MNINHEASTIFEALEISESQKNDLNETLSAITKEIIKGDIKKPSMVAERLRDTLSYSELVFIATQYTLENSEKISRLIDQEIHKELGTRITEMLRNLGKDLDT